MPDTWFFYLWLGLLTGLSAVACGIAVWSYYHFSSRVRELRVDQEWLNSEQQTLDAEQHRLRRVAEDTVDTKIKAIDKMLIDHDARITMAHTGVGNLNRELCQQLTDTMTAHEATHDHTHDHHWVEIHHQQFEDLSHRYVYQCELCKRVEEHKKPA